MSKDRTQTAADKKNCKHCYSTIHRRASVCPVCQKTVTYRGQLSGFLTTAFPILTAILSLGFAAYEKYENIVVTEQKQIAQRDLALSQTLSEATEEELTELASQRLPLAIRRESIRATRPDSLEAVPGQADLTRGNVGNPIMDERQTQEGTVINAEKELQDIEAEINVLAEKGLSKNKMKISDLQKQLIRKKFYLKNGLNPNR